MGTSDLGETLDEEVFHAAFARLSPADQRAVLDLFPGFDESVAEELVYDQLWKRPREPFPGEPRGLQVLRHLRTLNVFRSAGNRSAKGWGSGQQPSMRRKPNVRSGSINIAPLQPVATVIKAVGLGLKFAVDYGVRDLIDRIGDFNKNKAAQPAFSIQPKNKFDHGLLRFRRPRKVEKCRD